MTAAVCRRRRHRLKRFYLQKEGRTNLSFSFSAASCLTLIFFIHLPFRCSTKISFTPLLFLLLFRTAISICTSLFAPFLVCCDVLFLTPQRRNVFSLVYRRRVVVVSLISVQLTALRIPLGCDVTYTHGISLRSHLLCVKFFFSRDH